MNILFFLILLIILIIGYFISKKNILVAHFIIIGYMFSLFGVLFQTFSMKYYIYLILFFFILIILESLAYSVYPMKWNINISNKYIDYILVLNIFSFIYMLIVFIKKFGMLNPFLYSFKYENNLYLEGWALIYRSAIPLYLYYTFKILVNKEKKILNFFAVIYLIFSLLIKFNKTDIFILIISSIIIYFISLNDNKRKFKKYVKIIFLSTSALYLMIYYFYAFYIEIVKDEINIFEQFKTYLSGGQVYFNYILQNSIWNRGGYYNFFNILNGYRKPNRIYLDGITTNVYGLLGDIYTDFGFWGMFIGPIIIVIICLVIRSICNNNILANIFIFTYFSLAFFNPYILLTEFWVQVFHLFIICFIIKIFRTRYRFNIKFK